MLPLPGGRILGATPIGDTNLWREVMPTDPDNPYQCSDLDSDTCDDCTSGNYNTSDDGLDNDEDGLVDEKRDNDAGFLTENDPTYGISNTDNFLEFYNLDFEDLRDHWSGDEDQDWVACKADSLGNCFDSNGTF